MLSQSCRRSIYGEYATWQVMEEYLPRETHQNYRSVFNKFDAGGIGVISIEDVATCVSNSHMTYSNDDIRRVMHKVIKCDHCYSKDVKFVDFLEFLSINLSLNTNCIPEDEMLKIFNIFDQDGDGFIGREELRSLLSKLGDEVSEKEVEEMIEEADKDGDGLVSYQEFVRIITNSSDNPPPLSSSSETSDCSINSSVTSSTCDLNQASIQDIGTVTDDVFAEESQNEKFIKLKKSSKRRSLRKSFRTLTRTKSKNDTSPMQVIQETGNPANYTKSYSLPANIKYRRKSCFEFEQKKEEEAQKLNRIKSLSVTNFVFRKSRKLRKSLSSY